MLNTHRRPWRHTALLATTFLVATGCTTSIDPAPPDDPTPTNDGPGAGAPERIVSLSPTSTEVLFAIGAGDQVVAVDDQSDFPAQAPTTELSGFEPNLEAIASYEPDLVLVADDVDGLVDGLEQLEVEVLVQPAAADLDEAFAQMRTAGEATGHAEAADTLVEELRSEIDTVVAAAGDTDGLRYYHELDPNLFTATSDTFIGEVYGLFGLDNVADEADDDTAFPQLSPEFVIDADPELIVVTDHAGEGPDEIAQRPGWETVTAVADDQVQVVDSDVASRWGPRMVEFVQRVADALHELTAAA